MKSSVLRLTLETSRSTTSPLCVPMPGSMTSVALEPTTMPTLGTIGTFSSGMTWTCCEILTVLPAFTSGTGGCAVCAATLPAHKKETAIKTQCEPGRPCIIRPLVAS
jgi:hypothetical protein